MSGRFARDDEVAAWREDGWVLLEDLVDADEIDAAAADLRYVFPLPEKFHADPERYRPPGRSDADLRRGYPEMPDNGPGVPSRTAPIPRRVPVLRQRSAHAPDGASRDRRLHGARARLDRPARVPGAGQREVRGRRELRTADAHRSQPLVPAAEHGVAVVARRVVPVSDRCRRGNRADAPRPAR